MFLSLDGDGGFCQSGNSVRNDQKGDGTKDVCFKTPDRLTMEKERDRPAQSATGTPIESAQGGETEIRQRLRKGVQDSEDEKTRQPEKEFEGDGYGFRTEPEIHNTMLIER